MKQLLGLKSSDFLDVLFARLQIVVPSARSILIAALNDGDSVTQITDKFVEQAAAAKQSFRVLKLADEPTPPEDRQEVSRDSGPRTYVMSGDAGSVEKLRSVVREFAGWSFVEGSSLLTSPATVRAAIACDGTVLVVKRGRDTRSDVAAVSREINEAGGRLLGIVLRK